MSSADTADAATAGRFFLGRHRVVNAGAGTGKTHALLTQYLHLLAGLTVHGQKLEPRAVCALTFTEKAAGEMRERLARRLRQLIAGLAELADNAERSDELARLEPLEPALSDSARRLGRPLPSLAEWEAAQGQLPMAPIGTFHSFASALLRRHAVAAGLDPDFSLFDADTARELLESASERVVLAALEGQHGPELAAATASLCGEYGFRGGSLSSGLVESLCQLYLSRAEEGLDAAGLSAAYEPPLLDRERQRIQQALDEGLRTLGELVPELTGKSAESAQQLSARRPAIVAGLERLDEAALASVQPGLIELQKEHGKLRAPKDTSGSGIAERLRHNRDQLKLAIAEVAALRLSILAAPLAVGIEQLLALVAAIYAESKADAAGLDFTDLLRRARDLLREVPAVRQSEQARYAALLVDEFQDTSPLQADLLRLLIDFEAPDSPATATGLGPRRLYLVGDRKQSIYGFRGADVSAYERICDELLAAGAEEETLAVSWRSRPGLIATTNQLFPRVFPSGGPREAGQLSWDEARDRLQASRPDPDGPPAPLCEQLRPRLGPSSNGDTDGSRPTTPTPTASSDDPPGREAQLVARRILAFTEQGFGFGQVVLLLRRYTHLLRYTTALKLAAIPHYVVRGRGFFQAQEVLDLAAFLTVLDDPEDRLALLGLLRSPLCGLSDESLVRLHLAGRLSPLTLLRDGADDGLLTPLPRDEAARLSRILGLLRALSRCGDRIGPAACLQTLLDQTDFLAVLSADPDGEQRVANVLRLGERARASEARGGNLRSFVRALRRETDPRLAEQRPERDEPTAPIVTEAEDVVRVMTVHQAKGLEFPVVLIAGCASLERSETAAITYDRAVGLGLKLLDGGERAPTLAARQVHKLGRQRSAAESGRLFYVAATRAKERLCFVGELRPGRRPSSGSWQAALDGLRPDHPELLTEWRPAATGRSISSPPELAPPPPESSWAIAAAEQLVVRVYDRPQTVINTGTPLPALSLASAVDLLLCGRRFQLRHRLGLHSDDDADSAEPAPAAGRDEETRGLGALATVAAAVLDQLIATTTLEERSERVVHNQLLLRGLDLQSPEVAELGTRLLRFLHSRFVVEIARRSGPPLRPALPYDQTLLWAGERLRLRGVLDLVVGPREGRGGEPARRELLEYRYGYAPEPTAPLERLRQQLRRQLATVLFPDERVVLGSCFLREADPQPRWHDEREPPFEVEPPSLDGGLGAIVRLGATAALRLPVLEPRLCLQASCGYRVLCHRLRSDGAATDSALALG